MHLNDIVQINYKAKVLYRLKAQMSAAFIYKGHELLTV